MKATPNAERPLVSVVIPAHNAAHCLMRALNSVWTQDYENLEVIVVDDCSKDATSDLLASIAEHDVRTIRLDKNQGASAARNVGISIASGEYIAFLDSDDEWLPQKISKQVSQISENAQISFVACHAEYISAFGATLGLLGEHRPPATGTEAWKTLLAHTFVATPCVLARRDALLKVGGFDPNLRVAEDQDLWIRLALIGEVGYLYEPLVRVHDTPQSLTKRNCNDEMTFMLPMIFRHVAEQRARLSAAEYRRIVGERLATAGRNAYWAGRYGIGMRLILRAIGYGYEPFENMRYLLAASPIVRLLRSKLNFESAR